MAYKVWTNHTGTTSETFTIGKGGATIHHGDGVPAGDLGTDGDLYIRHGESSGFYQRVDGAWKAITIGFIRQEVQQGDDSAILADASYVALVDGEAAATGLTLPEVVPGTTIVVKDETGTAGTYPITIGGAPVDGQENYVVSTNYGSVTLAFFTSWMVVRSV